MRPFLTVLLATCGLIFVSACSMSHGDKTQQAAVSSAPQSTVSGVLIDQACGTKMMAEKDPEKAATDHPRSCAMKADCAASGYAVISGSEMIKFDDNGNQLAKDFLQKSDKTDDLHVNVQGIRDGDKMAVTSIDAK